MNEIISTIEKDLILSRITRLKKLPKLIYDQLDRIEKQAFKIYKLDSVFTGSIMLDSFTACANSRLTLDQLERILKLESNNYKTFEKLLKKAVKTANKRKNTFASNLIKKYFDKTPRNKIEVR